MLLGERTIDVIAFLAVVTLALVVRWPYLSTAPRFTDEIQEVLRGLLISQGRLLPLTSVDSYIGAIQNYAVALVFLVSGQNPWSPRLISWFLGGLTVGLTYPLGMEIARSVGLTRTRLVGALSSMMLAMAGVHVIVNSHIAWSNSMTPFFTTLGLWLVMRVVRTRAAWPMVIAGLSFGLALQTHLLAGMFIPAIILFVIVKAPWLLRSRWTYVGIGLFMLAYASVLVHNLMYLGDTLTHAQYIRTRKNYLADGPLPESDFMAIVRNVGRSLGMLGETLVTSMSTVDDWPLPVDIALVGFGLGTAVAALLWAAKLGQPLPLLALLGTLLILPVANPGRYSTITDGRYVSPLLPLCYAAIAAMILSISGRRWLFSGAVALLAVVFLIQPVGPMLRYVWRISLESPTNQDIARSVALIDSRASDDDVVLLDNRLNLGARNIASLRETRAAYDGFSYLLPFEKIRIITTQVSRGAVEERLRRRDRLFVIVPPGYRSELQAGRVTAVRSSDAPLPMDPASSNRPLYEIYLVESPGSAAQTPPEEGAATAAE